jgi:hypothetical protein
VLNGLTRLNYRRRLLYHDNSSQCIRDELWKLIDAQIKTFGEPLRLTSCELSDFSYRAERIRRLGEELDRMGRTAFSGKQFGRIA